MSECGGVSGDFKGNHEEEVKRLEQEQIVAEAEAFSEQINNLLRHDTHLMEEKKTLPLNSPDDFFDRNRDGVIMCKLINAIKPGMIKEKFIKTNVDWKNCSVPGSKDIFEIAANNGLVLKAAKDMGCNIVNIGHEDILEGNKNLILAVVWQLIRAHLMKSVNLMSHPELIRLLQPGEKIDKLLNMRAEDIIKRWFNYHLKRAGPDSNGQIRRVDNFGNDVKDSEKWTVLFQQIAPHAAKAAGIDNVLKHSDLRERAHELLEVSEKLDCREFTTVNDIVKGHERLNLAYTATIFNKHIGITLPTEDEIERLYKELEELRRLCILCNENREELQKRLAELKKQKESMASGLSKVENDVKNSSSGTDTQGLLDKKNAEIAKLEGLLDGKDLAGKVKALTAALDSFRGVENDLESKRDANKSALGTLQGEIDDLNAAIKDLQELADGKGNSVEEMREKLKKLEAQNAEKSSIINDYIDQAKKSFAVHAEKLEIELPTTDSEDDKERLQNIVEANTVLIKKYQEVLGEKQADFKRHEDEERRQLEELNREVGAYLGEGQSSAEDAIANMKRLLELMIEKCKKQAIHIQTQQVTIEKKNQINTVMAQKVCDIAQTQKHEKKKPKKK